MTFISQKSSLQKASPLPPVWRTGQSVLGQKWELTALNERLAEGISQAFGLPDILGRLLVARGICFKDVENFLNPALKTQLPDPSILRDMDKAAERIADAVMN